MGKEKKKAKTMLQLAKAASPLVLEHLGKEKNLPKSTVDSMNEALTNAIENYGLENPLTIQTAVQTVVPAFVQIADRYFFLMRETLRISEDLGLRYDKYTIQMVNAILSDESADIATKTALVNQFIAARRKEDRKDVNTPMFAATGLSAVLGLGALAAFLRCSDNKKEIAVEALKASKDVEISKEAINAIKFIVLGLLRWNLP